MARNDLALLQAALIGYQTELERINAAMADIQKRLAHSRNGHIAPMPVAKGGPVKKHRISAEGRRRIAEAQRKRWAAAKKAK